MALHRAGQADQNGFVESFNGRMRDELLKESLFLSLAQARTLVADWIDDYNTARPRSSLGYATPAAFAANFPPQRAASLRAAEGYAPQPVAPPAHMRNNNRRSLVQSG